MRIPSFLLVSVMLTPLHSDAVEVPKKALLVCPGEVLMEPPSELAAVPEGWKGVPRRIRHDLTGGAVYLGPETQAKPVESTAVGKGYKWRLTVPHPGPYWLECQYGQAGAVLLREVPKNAKACAWLLPGRARGRPSARGAPDADDGIYCK